LHSLVTSRSHPPSPSARRQSPRSCIKLPYVAHAAAGGFCLCCSAGRAAARGTGQAGPGPDRECVQRGDGLRRQAG
jgi:hypothetical protein